MSRVALILLASVAWADQVDPPMEHHLYGVHSAALAGAAVVGAQGVDALLVNPAGRIVGTRPQVCVGAHSLSHGRSLAWAGVTVPRDSWGLSATWATASVGDIRLRDEEGLLTGTTSWRRHRIGLGLARRVDFFTYAGIEGHYLRVECDGADADGMGVDVGLVRHVLPPLLSVGCAVHDLFSSLAYHEPASRRETVRPRYTAGIKIGLAEGKIQIEWNAFTRGMWRRWRTMGGLRATLGRGLTARVGVGEDGMTAGIGLSLGHVSIRYAVLPDGLGTLGRGAEAVWTR